MSDKVTLSGKPVDFEYANPNKDSAPAPQPIDPATGMHGDYWILSDEERAKGFIRPVRRSYIHVGRPLKDPSQTKPDGGCGGITTMNIKLAETYARDPQFYGGTFCSYCRSHFPVGPEGEFVWTDPPHPRVGT